MSRWRVGVILALFFAPFVFLIGVGSYHLWDRGWTFYVWWPMALCFTASFLLGWWWQKKKQLLPAMDFGPIPHGTDRDQEAWRVVETRANAADKISMEKLSEPPFYLQTLHELSLEIARVYYPNTKDAYGALTVPEVLAVAELAGRDLSDLVQKYVPGSHILTINDWKNARSAVDWYRRARNLYWVASAVLNPVETVVRFAASKVATGQTWDLLQQNLLQWFYAAYVNRFGTYLIELYSGRLKVGVERHRQLLAQHEAADRLSDNPTDAAPPGPAEAPPREVAIALFGQVKVGKSSAVNALLGEQKAVTDVLPATSEVTRYRLPDPAGASTLVLLDTVGYGNEGPSEDQLRVTEDLARQSDLLLLVMHARNPARHADVQFLDRLKAWFATRPELKMPPVVGVLTHVDLLSPAMEWAPPYDWLHPQRPKEEQMRQAVQAALDQFAGRLTVVVPVCTVAGKVFGVDEGLLPVISEKLGEARMVAMLRCLKAEADDRKVRRVFEQIWAAGKEVARQLLANAK
jgi:predicted GTPase